MFFFYFRETVIVLIYTVKRNNLLIHSEQVSIEKTEIIQKTITETTFISKRVYTISKIKIEESIKITELFNFNCKIFIKTQHISIVERNIAVEYKEEYKLDASINVLVKIVKIIEEFTETG